MLTGQSMPRARASGSGTERRRGRGRRPARTRPGRRCRGVVGSAAKETAKVASGHGFRVVLPPISSSVSDLTGPLLDGEIERALASGDLLGARVVAAVQPSVG